MGIFRLSKPVEGEKVKEAPESPVEAVAETPKAVEDSGMVVKKTLNEKALVIDGPLGQLYTEALNQVYAKEASAALVETLYEKLEKEVDDGYDASFLYVVDGPTIEGSGSLEAFESISRMLDRGKTVYLCVEHRGNIGVKTGSLMSYAREHGVVVMSERNRMIDTLRQKVL